MSISYIIPDRLKAGDEVIYRGLNKSLFNCRAKVKGISWSDDHKYWVEIYGEQGTSERLVRIQCLRIPEPTVEETELDQIPQEKERKELPPLQKQEIIQEVQFKLFT